MDFLRSIRAESALYTWGLLLALGIPLLVLLLSEVLERLRRRRSRLFAPVSNLRNLLLPLVSLWLILHFILGLARALLVVQVVETLLWLMVMYCLLQLFGALLGNTRLEGAQTLGAAEAVATQEIQLPRVWSELLRLATVVGVTFYILGGVWGAPMEQVLTALGVGSIVIGFALQDTLSSLVAGLLLAFEKPFVVGHWVRYGVYEGQIIEMNWRAVRIRTLERDVVIIPNSLMGKEVAVNFTLLDPLHAELVQVSFAYQHPPNQVKRMLLETALATPGVVAQPLPHIRILGYAYDKVAIDYQIKLYTSDYSRMEFIRDEVLTRIYYAAQRYNFTPPYSTTIFYQRMGDELAAPEQFPMLLTQVQALPYFARLTAAAHQQLAKGAAFQFYGAEERLIEQGMSFKGFYIILEGSVQLHITTDDGRAHEVARLGVGDFFGETLLLRNRISAFGVLVLQDMKALFIERDTFLAVVESNPLLANEMNRFIEARAKLTHPLLETADIIMPAPVVVTAVPRPNGGEAPHPQPNGGEAPHPSPTAAKRRTQ